MASACSVGEIDVATSCPGRAAAVASTRAPAYSVAAGPAGEVALEQQLEAVEADRRRARGSPPTRAARAARRSPCRRCRSGWRPRARRSSGVPSRVSRIPRCGAVSTRRSDSPGSQPGELERAGSSAPAAPTRRRRSSARSARQHAEDPRVHPHRDRVAARAVGARGPDAWRARPLRSSPPRPPARRTPTPTAARRAPAPSCAYIAAQLPARPVARDALGDQLRAAGARAAAARARARRRPRRRPAAPPPAPARPARAAAGAAGRPGAGCRRRLDAPRRSVAPPRRRVAGGAPRRGEAPTKYARRAR